MFHLCWTYILTVLDLCFDFLGKKLGMFGLSRQKLGMFGLSRQKLVIFPLSWPKSGLIRIVLDLRLVLGRGILVTKLRLLDFQSRTTRTRSSSLSYSS